MTKRNSGEFKAVIEAEMAEAKRSAEQMSPEQLNDELRAWRHKQGDNRDVSKPTAIWPKLNPTPPKKEK